MSPLPADECKHLRASDHKLDVGAGGFQILYWCPDCRRKLSPAKSHRHYTQEQVDAMPWITRAELDAGEDEHRRRLEEQKQATIEKTRRRRERLSAHLRTFEWQVKRRQVFERSGGRCEGCAKPITIRTMQVHHKDYATLGDELLDHLAAYCRSCHKRAVYRDEAAIISLYTVNLCPVCHGLPVARVALVADDASPDRPGLKPTLVCQECYDAIHDRSAP